MSATTKPIFLTILGILWASATGAIESPFSTNPLSAGATGGTHCATTPVAANRLPLLRTPFIALPLGSVHPLGWLLKQCELQRDGLTGNAETLYANDLGTNSGWLGGPGENWERGPYYFKGLVALAYTLNDPILKQKAQKWMDWLLDHQRADGYIGPASNSDWWPRMIATYALRDYYEATGDPRVPAVLENYFHYMLANLPARPLNEWGRARAGDEMDVALWLYNRTGDTDLLSLVRLLRRQAYDWPGIFTNDNFYLFGKDFQPKHNVNVEEALKMPAVYDQLSREPGLRNAISLGLDNLMRENALSFGINSGTEFLAGDASVQGVELCAIVEAMLSLETSVRITGDPLLADRLETISFNALPAALANHIKAIQYYTLANNVIANYGGHGFDQDYANGTLPGPYSGYPCCRYNFHMGWPKFVQNSWAATADGGLAIIAYGPTVVNAAPGGAQVQITEDTGYPFEEQVRLKISMKRSGDSLSAEELATFPLVLRIPGWCAQPAITVNGQAQTGMLPGSFFRVRRAWSDGDSVVINLPMPIQTLAGPSRALAINRGPLVYSLRIGEQWTVRTPDPRGAGFDEFAIHATTPWNYALQLDPQNPAASLTFTNFWFSSSPPSSSSFSSGPLSADPFDPANHSVALITQARRLPNWTIGWRGTHAFEPPVSPVASDSPLETVTLVPFGSQHLRVSWFPYLGTPSPVAGSFDETFDPSWCSRWTTFGGNWSVRNGVLSTVPGSANGAKALVPATAFTNFVYAGDVQVGGAGNAGLIFRVSKPDIGADTYCGYYAGINSKQSELEFGYADNGWHEIKTVPMQFAANQSYHLKIRALGTLLQVYVNGSSQAAIAVSDGHFAGGMIGVRDYCDNPDESISSFSNLKANELGPNTD